VTLAAQTGDANSALGGGTSSPELRVINGASGGARMPIQLGSQLTIGSAVSNDVVLRDASVGDNQVAVTGGALQADARHLQIGDVQIQFDRGNPVTHAAQPQEPNETQAVPESAGTGVVAPTGFFRSKLPMPPLVSGTLTAAVAVAILLTFQFASTGNSGEAPMSVAALLEPTAFAHLKVQDGEAETTVSGLINTREDAISLEALLQQSEEPIVNATQVSDVLSARVADVFRVNGVDADVEVTGMGAVTVVTSVEPDEIERLRDVVSVDLPQLHSLEIDNTPPPINESQTAEAPGIDPGKRVAMVVSDTPAYVVTEDLSRYFIGSLLPSGHRIEAISEGRVSLVKAGVITELEF